MKYHELIEGQSMEWDVKGGYKDKESSSIVTKRVQYVMKGAVCDEECITVLQERDRAREKEKAWEEGRLCDEEQSMEWRKLFIIMD